MRCAVLALLVSGAAAVLEPDLLQHVNGLGFRMMQHLSAKEPAGNVLLGTTSVASLLGMIMAGSVGKTYKEIADVLGFTQSVRGNRVLHEWLGGAARRGGGSSCVFSAVPLRPHYRTYVERVYGANATRVAFTDPPKAQTVINQWVNASTQGAIPEFLPQPLPDYTKLLLVSTQRFAAPWEQPFIQNLTKKMQFQTPDGNVTTDMMVNLGRFDYMLSKKLGCHAVVLPFVGGGSLVAIQPLNRSMSLSEMLSSLSWAEVRAMVTSALPQTMTVHLPRMTLSSFQDLRPALVANGLQALFNKNESNLALMLSDGMPKVEEEPLTRIESELTDEQLQTVTEALANPGVYVDAVVQSVRLAVHERGAEAAAAAAVSLARRGERFRADRPFAALLLDADGLLAYAAAVNDPTRV